MNELIINILKSHAVNEENQAGMKGSVIWEEDLEKVTVDIKKLFVDYIVFTQKSILKSADIRTADEILSEIEQLKLII